MVLEVRIVVILGVEYRETRRASAALVIFCFLLCLELLTLRQAGRFTVVYLFACMLCFNSKCTVKEFLVRPNSDGNETSV